MQSEHSVLGVHVVEVQQMVRRVPLPAEARVDHRLLPLLVVRPRNVVHRLELGPREGVEHVGHPLALNRFDRVVHSGPAGLERLAAQLVPEPVQRREYLILLQTAEREVLEVAVDVCAGDEGVVVALDDEVELDVVVLLHELLEGGRDQRLPHPRRAAAEVAEVDR